MPRSVFTKPYGDTNIVRHMTAVTTVSTAHGTSTVVRSRPCPRKAACIASAMPRPMSSSSVTDDTVKMSVCVKRRPPLRDSTGDAVVAQPSDPAQRERPAPATLYSCSDSQIA